ncbi:DEAD/DEAH box helicase [Zavarzinella formosa]|uniref:DEAD/DEAH box helicase n=1 Tax=Zavarzinella formosa TaxID=360055 RepID=UPI0002FA9E2A|nr:DEAD/DEAH box helicase [Zavarzinella formosa]
MSDEIVSTPPTPVAEGMPAPTPVVAATPPPNPFNLLGLDPRLVKALGYSDPSPIQREAIPPLLAGKDLVGLAGTGTGKTAAFALPMIHKLVANNAKRQGVSGIILAPTRELAVQVAKAVANYGKPVGIEVLAVYGGTGYSDQIRSIRRGVDIIVATPGRCLDLIRKGKMPLDTINTVVLDEADEMLDMGFAEDIEAILSETPATRQTMLFSATMPPRIEDIAAKHLRSPMRIKVARDKSPGAEAPKVRQTAYVVRRDYKLTALGRILDLERPTSAIIFCRTRTEADELTETLGRRGFKPMALHGGLSQEQRDRVMKAFRTGTADLLIATDIAARGLDIEQLSHVVNFDVPPQAEAYVHRIGRVGRAGRAGVAITLATPNEQYQLKHIERETNQRIELAKVPTVEQLRQSRVDHTAEILREALADTNFTSDLRGMIGKLAEDFSVQDIALAAARMMIRPSRAEDDVEIPDAQRDSRNDRGRPGPGGGSFGGPGGGNRERARAGGRPTSKGMAKVFFGIGRDAGITPRDLVGAIANEVGIPGKDLGQIDVTDRFSLVEVPVDVAEYVVEVMEGSRIRGRKVHVRPDRAPRG